MTVKIIVTVKNSKGYSFSVIGPKNYFDFSAFDYIWNSLKIL